MPAVEQTAVIRQDPGNQVQYVDVWFDVEQVFGKKRFKAKIWYDGHLYRGLVAKYNGVHRLLMNAAIRGLVRKAAGDTVHVRVEEDTDPRVVAVPDDLQRLLQHDLAAKARFDTLSYTHRREYVSWINEAKRESTRSARLEKCLQMLRATAK